MQNILIRIIIGIFLIVLTIAIFYIFSVALIFLLAFSIAIGIIGYITAFIKRKNTQNPSNSKSVKHITVTQEQD